MKGNISVAAMQTAGAWFSGGNNNRWMPISLNSLDSTSVNYYFYQESLSGSPILKDSAIGSAEVSVWKNMQKDFIKKDWEIKFSSTGVFNSQRFELPISTKGILPSLQDYATAGANGGTGDNENSFWEDYLQGIKDSAFYDRVEMAKKYIENPMSFVWDATMLPANMMLAPLTVNIELVTVMAFGDSHDRAHYLGEQTEQFAEMGILYGVGKIVDRIPRMNFIGKSGLETAETVAKKVLIEYDLQFFAKKDLQQVTDAAKQIGVDQNIFGEYIHEIKEQLRMKASDNFSYKELLEYAKELKDILKK